MQDSKHKGTVLIYAIILVNFAVILGYMIFSRSQILYENSRFSQMNTKLSKNIEERGSASIEYDIALNQTGSGFLDTTNCPVLSLSGTNLGSTYTENIPTTVDKIGTEVYCSGSSVSHTWQTIHLSYTSDFLSFSGVSFWSATASLAGTSTLTGLLNDADGSVVSLNLGSMSGIDSNFDSDNYQPYSTGTIQYPVGYMEDDDLARKVSYGYIRKDGIFRNVFWNNSNSASRIRKNTNNTGALAIFPDETGTWYLHLDLDSTYQIKIVEFNPTIYSNTKELVILNTVSQTSSTGAIGYLQSDLSIATGSSNAKIFDLKNKNYGIFIASDSSVWNFLKYKNYFVDESGKMIYTVPLDDSDSNQITYFGSDIIIDSDNRYVAKEQEIIQPKP